MNEGLQINLSMAGVQQTLGSVTQLQSALTGISQKISGLSTLGKIGIFGSLSSQALGIIKDIPNDIRTAQILWRQWDNEIKASTSFTDFMLSPFKVAGKVGGKMMDDFFGFTEIKNLKASNDLRNKELQINQEIADIQSSMELRQREIAKRIMTLGPGYSLIREHQTEIFQKEMKMLNLQEEAANNRGANAKTEVQAIKAAQEIREIAARRQLLLTQDHLTMERTVAARKDEESSRADESLANQARVEDRLLKIKQDQFDVNHSMVTANFRLTEIQKREQTLTLLIKEREAIKEQVDLLQKRQDALDPNNPDDRFGRELLQGRIDQTERRGLDVESKISGIEGAPKPSSFTDQFTSTLSDLQNIWGTWATQAAASFKNVFESAVGSISNGITGLIMGTQTWAQALANIGNQVLNSIISAIVQMGVRWIATRILMATVGKAIAAASVAATVPIAAAQAAVWATPAALSTIASYGGAAAAAPGFIAAAEAATLALSAFQRGGYTGDGPVNSVAGIVHRGEYVIPAPQVHRIGVGNIESMVSGMTAKSGGSQNIAFFDDGSKLSDWARTQDGETVIVDVVRRSLHKFGQA